MLPVYPERSRQLSQSKHVTWLQSLICKIPQPLLFFMLLPWQQGLPDTRSCGITQKRREREKIQEFEAPGPGSVMLSKFYEEICLCSDASEKLFLTVVLLEHLCVKQVGHNIVLHFQQEEDVWQGDTAPGLTFDPEALALPGRG